MDLKVIIMRCNLKYKDELTFPKKIKKQSKFRTELVSLTSNPKYVKNLFNFQGISMGSRVAIKLGCFTSRMKVDMVDTTALIRNSKIFGQSTLTLTQRLITQLREKNVLEREMVLLDEQKNEMGRIYIVIKFKTHLFEDKIDEDVLRVKRVYYDVFENDIDVIEEKLGHIISMNNIKQKELEKIEKRLNFIRSAYKSIALESQKLKREREHLEQKNKQLRTSVGRVQSVKELNIHLDMLQQSDHGIEVLRKMYAKLLNKLEYERRLYNQNSERYFKIEDQVEFIKTIQSKQKEVKSAGKDLKFHLDRCKDQLPRIRGQKATIRSQENVIKNLQKMIKQNAQKFQRQDHREINIQVSKLAHQQNILKEKHKQLLLSLEMNDGRLPYKEFQRFKEMEFIKEDPKIVHEYKNKAEQCMEQIQYLTQKIEENNIKNDIQSHRQDNDQWYKQHKDDISFLKYQIQNTDTKAEILEEEIKRNAKQQAAEIVKLKQQVAVYNGLLTGVDKQY